jgi:DNA-binding PadR family transcriptional regulator
MSRADDGRIEAYLPLTDLAFNILLLLTDTELHGYALVKALREQTGRRRLRTGTVYAALARIQEDGLLDETDPPDSSEDARRRYYRATPLGEAVARAEAARLQQVVTRARDKALLPKRTREA